MKNLIGILLLAGAIALGLAVVSPTHAADTTIENLEVQKVDRIWRVQIFTDFGTEQRVEILHERVRVVDGEVIGREQQPTVTRAVSPILAQEVTLESGKHLTIAELQEAIIRFDAAFRAEDAAP